MYTAFRFGNRRLAFFAKTNIWFTATRTIFILEQKTRGLWFLIWKHAHKHNENNSHIADIQNQANTREAKPVGIRIIGIRERRR